MQIDGTRRAGGCLLAEAKRFESETEDVKARTAEQLRFGPFVAKAEEKLRPCQSIIAKF